MADLELFDATDPAEVRRAYHRERVAREAAEARVAELERQLDSAHELNAQVSKNYRNVVRERDEARAACYRAENEWEKAQERVAVARREALEEAAKRWETDEVGDLTHFTVPRWLRALAEEKADD